MRGLDSIPPPCQEEQGGRSMKTGIKVRPSPGALEPLFKPPIMTSKRLRTKSRSKELKVILRVNRVQPPIRVGGGMLAEDVCRQPLYNIRPPTASPQLAANAAASPAMPPSTPVPAPAPAPPSISSVNPPSGSPVQILRHHKRCSSAPLTWLTGKDKSHRRRFTTTTTNGNRQPPIDWNDPQAMDCYVARLLEAQRPHRYHVSCSSSIPPKPPPTTNTPTIITPSNTATARSRPRSCSAYRASTNRPREPFRVSRHQSTTRPASARLPPTKSWHLREADTAAATPRIVEITPRPPPSPPLPAPPPPPPPKQLPWDDDASVGSLKHMDIDSLIKGITNESVKQLPPRPITTNISPSNGTTPTPSPADSPTTGDSPGPTTQPERSISVKAAYGNASDGTSGDGHGDKGLEYCPQAHGEWTYSSRPCSAMRNRVWPTRPVSATSAGRRRRVMSASIVLPRTYSAGCVCGQKEGKQDHERDEDDSTDDALDLDLSNKSASSTSTPSSRSTPSDTNSEHKETSEDPHGSPPAVPSPPPPAACLVSPVHDMAETPIAKSGDDDHKKETDQGKGLEKKENNKTPRASSGANKARTKALRRVSFTTKPKLHVAGSTGTTTTRRRARRSVLQMETGQPHGTSVAYWDSFESNYSTEIFDSLLEDRKKVIMKRIKEYCHDSVTAVDFGCGVGKYLFALASRCEKVYAIDISEKLLNHARRLCARYCLSNVTSEVADLGAGVWAEGSSCRPHCLPMAGMAQVVVCANVMISPEPMTRAALLSNIKEVLAVGGHVLLLVPSVESTVMVRRRHTEWLQYKRAMKVKSSLKRVAELEETCVEDEKLGIYRRGGVRTMHYREQDLERMLRLNGFKVMSMDKVEYDWNTELPPPTAWMRDPRPFDWLVVAKKKPLVAAI